MFQWSKGEVLNFIFMEYSVQSTSGGSLNILLEPELSPAVRAVLLGASGALELIDEPATITLANRRFVYVNHAFESLYGFSAASILGKVDVPLHDKSLPSMLIEAIYEGTAAGGWKGQIENQNRDGQRFQIVLRTRPLFTQEGEIAGYLGLCHPCEWQRMPVLLKEDTLSVAIREPAPRLIKSPTEGLSQREREVLGLYGQGKPTKEIAFILNISIPSVFTYRARLVRKLGIKTPADFYLFAAQFAGGLEAQA
jgi:PAS domain S-box-containing protein